MRIALNEIDPHIASMYAVMAPAPRISVPTPRRQGVRLSRRRRAALAASLVAPPMLGLQLAIWANNPYPANMWLPWVVWFGTWAVGTGAGSFVTLRKRLPTRSATALMTGTALAAPALGFAAAMAAFNSGPGPSFAFWMMWLAVSLPMILFGSQLALNIAPEVRQITSLQRENAASVFAAMSLTRAERIYCDALLFLARTEAGNDIEQIMRDTLPQVNELLASSRQLDSRRTALLPLMGASVEAELHRERLSLERRLEATVDPIARAALEQSAQMVQARIENARNLGAGLERLNAQQEAVTQTLASTLSSLARLQVMSHASTGNAMQDVTRIVDDMHQQTVAVEKAVEEVLMLRQ